MLRSGIGGRHADLGAKSTHHRWTRSWDEANRQGQQCVGSISLPLWLTKHFPLTFCIIRLAKQGRVLLVPQIWGSTLPVRKIPKNYLFVTGGFASKKNDSMIGFESLLEKEYMLLLEFDETVEGYEEQPVKVPVPGTKRPYVVDLLVKFKPDLHGTVRPPELTEVKTTEDLAKNEAKYALKFKAADEFSSERGWVFVKRTEVDIRVPRLKNLKFLRRYRNHELAPEDHDRVVNALDAQGPTTCRALIQQLAMKEEERLALVPALWHLVITRSIGADLDTAWGEDVAIWPAGVAI